MIVFSTYCMNVWNKYILYTAVLIAFRCKSIEIGARHPKQQKEELFMTSNYIKSSGETVRYRVLFLQYKRPCLYDSEIYVRLHCRPEKPGKQLNVYCVSLEGEHVPPLLQGDASHVESKYNKTIPLNFSQILCPKWRCCQDKKVERLSLKTNHNNCRKTYW